MDFVSLESALLVQGGDPYYGYGWSLDPMSSSANIGGGADAADGGSSIVGPSSVVGARGGDGYSGSLGGGGGGIIGDGYGSNNGGVSNRLSTPLDPLLKYLRREYASSAGPQDVLTKELELLMNETGGQLQGGIATKGIGASSRQQHQPPPMVITAAAAEGGGPVGSLEGRGVAAAADPSSSAAIITSSPGRTVEDITQASYWVDSARASTPRASGGNQQQQKPRAISTGGASVPSPEHISSPLHASSSAPNAGTSYHQKRRRDAMPSFCHLPTSHTDNLLQTTPHLRHLSVASTDMSGEGLYDESKNIFAQLFNNKKSKKSSNALDGEGVADSSSSSSGMAIDYHTSLLRQRSIRRASLELASFLRLLSNEMPQEQFAAVESEVYSKVFSLVHSKATRADDRLAGVAALDALLTVPSADEERRAIRFGNNLSNGLKANATYADYEFLHAIARALGRMAMGAANVDRVEFEVGRSLEWLRSDRSDRRLAAVLVLRELARCAPTVFYGKTHNVNVLHHATAAAAAGSGAGGGVARDSIMAGLGGTNDFLDHIVPVLRDPQPIVRACAADALSECLHILMERQRRTMTAPLCTLHASMMEGLQPKRFPPPNNVNSGVDHNEFMMTAAVHAHGSLLVVSEMLKHSRNFMLPRFDEVCVAVLRHMQHHLVLIRLEVMRLIPRLARRCPEVYGRRYLTQSLEFLIASAAGTPTKSRIDARPTAFMSIGHLALAMSDESMGGGDITLPTVRILNLDPGPSMGSREISEDVEYHFVELKDVGDFQEKLEAIFGLISDNLKRDISKSGGASAISRCDVLGCFANFVEALGPHADPYVMAIVEDMFDAGLSEDLIRCLHSIIRSVPSKQLSIERRLFQEISSCLAGKAVDLFTATKNSRPSLSDHVVLPSTSSPAATSMSLANRPTLERNFMSSMSLSSMNPGMRPKKPQQSELDLQDAINRAESAVVVKPKRSDDILINKSMRPEVVDKLVLSLRTLKTIGESYMQVHASDDGNMLLPFLRNVIAQYFDHPSSNVRREAATTCCLLLLPFGDGNKENEDRFQLGGASGSLFEECIQKLLRMAVSDLSPVVRLCIVRGLDARYDAYLSLNLLAPLFLMLEDEALAVRAHTLQILGRLSRLNPAPILPGLRRVLMDLIIELRCGGDNGGGREVATRLIIIFLREEALQNLTRPFISSIIDALPLSDVAPRLATASLEALGELATVAHTTINPWLRRLISHILMNVQEQNSSKQRVSLWALGKIAFGTTYVVSPYLDYPQLLSQASDILPTTKRAPWDLRREVFRTFGILGALDPDRFGSGSTTRKGGGKGGGYFVELEDEKDVGTGHRSSAIPINGSATRNQPVLSTSLQTRNTPAVDLRVIPGGTNRKQAQESNGSRPKSNYKDSDNDEPAHLYMYEQYAMTAQPLSKLSPARRLSPSDEAFYPTVAVQALMRILKDSSLSNLHGMVMKVRVVDSESISTSFYGADTILLLPQRP